MKTQIEIELAIKQVSDGINAAEVRVTEAMERFTRSIRASGYERSDRSELEYEQEILRDLIVRKEILEWVLGKDS